MDPEVHLELIPRPPGHILVGNLLDIDAAHPIENLVKLAREYGPIFELAVPRDLAVVVDRGAHVGEMGWAVIVPAVLVPAHELHAHGSPDLLRHDRRRLGGILVAAVPERAGSLVILHSNLAHRQTEHAR